MGLKHTNVVQRASLVALLVVCVCGVLLWQLGGWTPARTADVGAVQALLVTAIQTQASILAIALSFSVLYVQVSVDAYAFRASKLLLRHQPFLDMVFAFVAGLVFNIAVVLLITPEPPFLPIAAAVVGSAGFVVGLWTLVRYVATVTSAVTPEAIIEELIADLTYEQNLEDALEATVVGVDAARWEDDEPIFAIMPLESNGEARVDGGLKTLADIASKMIRQRDYVVLQSIVDRILASGRGRPGRTTQRYGAGARQKRIAEKRRTVEEAAMVAYLAGVLIELWSTAVKSEDRVAARTIVAAMGQLLDRGILHRRVGHTNVLHAAVYVRLFKESGRAGWADVRQQVLWMLIDQLADIDQSPPPKWVGPNVERVQALFSDLGRDLFQEKIADLGAEAIVVRGQCILGRYAAAIGHGAVLFGVSDYLHERAKQAVAWRAQGTMAHMASSAGEMGETWASNMPNSRYHTRALAHLLLDGIEYPALAHNRACEDPPSVANFRSLDALEDIAKACIVRKRWHWLEQTLEVIPRLITDPRDTAFYAAAGFVDVLEPAVKRTELEAIRRWCQEAETFVEMNGKLHSNRLRSRMVRAISIVRRAHFIDPTSELAQRLGDLERRLRENGTPSKGRGRS